MFNSMQFECEGGHLWSIVEKSGTCVLKSPSGQYDCTERGDRYWRFRREEHDGIHEIELVGSEGRFEATRNFYEYEIIKKIKEPVMINLPISLTKAEIYSLDFECEQGNIWSIRFVNGSYVLIHPTREWDKCDRVGKGVANWKFSRDISDYIESVDIIGPYKDMYNIVVRHDNELKYLFRAEQVKIDI